MSPSASQPSTSPLEKQVEAYVAGCLCDAEAAVVEQQITTDPTVARAYADARLRADQADVGRCCGASGHEDPRHEDPRHDESCEPHSAGLISRLCRFFGSQRE